MQDLATGSIVEMTPAQLAKECEKINRLEKWIAQMPPVEMPVKHSFTHGPDGKVNLYCREIFMPAGTLLTSKIHKTEHHFVILSGSASVWTEENGSVTLNAGHIGITKPGARRVLFIHEDCRWATFHPVTTSDLKQIEAELIEPHDIPQRLPGHDQAKIQD